MDEALAPAPWREEGLAIVRAVAGGLLFGVPLLYTMEVWWTGEHTSPRQVLLVLVVLAIPVLALNRTAGFRGARDLRVRDAIADTIEALAIGVVITFVVLVLLQEVSADSSLRSALGKVVYECVPFCLGVGVARHFLQDRDGDGDGDGDGDDGGADEDDDALLDAQGSRGLSAATRDLGGTTIGAVFIALSIAPTDEVPMIASALRPAWLLALMAASLLASYAIVFVAEFRDQSARHRQEGPFQRPITETVVSYLVALLVAAALLWLFHRGGGPTSDLLDRAIVLGFPAAIGGAAGRLAV
jgi:putative integral membrane protein (TIGR02587 family)